MRALRMRGCQKLKWSRLQVKDRFSILPDEFQILASIINILWISAVPLKISRDNDFYFTLATGEYDKDEFNDRYSTYAVEIVNYGELRPMAVYSMVKSHDDLQKRILPYKFKWPGNQTEPPSGEPACGGTWKGPNCLSQNTLNEWMKFCEFCS